MQLDETDWSSGWRSAESFWRSSTDSLARAPDRPFFPVRARPLAGTFLVKQRRRQPGLSEFPSPEPPNARRQRARIRQGTGGFWPDGAGERLARYLHGGDGRLTHVGAGAN